MSTSEFGKHGSAVDHRRYLQVAPPKSRRRCWCGCGKRASYVGMANGVALTMACELGIRRWVKSGQVIVRRHP